MVLTIFTNVLPHMTTALEKLIEEYPSARQWCWITLSKNPSITSDFVEKHLNDPMYRWRWDLLSENPSITPSFVERHFDKPWDWSQLSFNPSITSSFVERHSDKPWCWYGLAQNPAIKPSFILKHPGTGWSWRELLLNPRITIRFIEKHLNDDIRAHFGDLSENIFGNDPRLIKIREKEAIRKILKKSDISSYFAIIPRDITKMIINEYL